MKKILIALLTVILLLVLVMPYVTGRVAEAVTKNVETQVNDNPLQYGALEIQQYQRGYRTTDFRFRWSPSITADSLLQGVIAFGCVAKHGVLNISYQCRAQDVPSYTDFVAEQLNGKDPLTIFGKVSVFGNITQQLRLDAFETLSEGGAKIAVQAGLVSVQTDQELTTFNLSGSLVGLKIAQADSGLDIGEVQLKGDLSRNQHNLLIGDVSANISQLASSEKDKGGNKLAGLVVHAQTSEAGENLNLDYRLAADQFIHNGMDEVKDFDDLQLRLNLSGVNMAQLVVVLQELQNLAKNRSKNTNNALKLAVLPEIAGLLKAGFLANAEMSAQHQSQPLNGGLSIELVDNLLLGDFILLAVNPQALLAKVDASLVSKIPQSMIDKTSQTPAWPATSAWYIRSPQGYISDFQLADGQLRLNGESLTTDEFMGLLSQ